jgi:LysM repeat protein
MKEGLCLKKYVIREGDTMYSISKKTGVRLPLLLASNPHVTNPDSLMPGMTIVIPELGKPAKNHLAQAKQMQSQKQKKAPAKQSAAPKYFGFVWPHVVGQGESTEGIAKRYRVTRDQLMMLNPHLNFEQPLTPGTTLYIPFMASPEAKKLPAKEAEVAVEPANGEGPHTHTPYRQSNHSSEYKYTVPPHWDGDVDESSSLLSSWDAWDQATATRSAEKAIRATDDGWSDTFTIKTDEDD